MMADCSKLLVRHTTTNVLRTWDACAGVRTVGCWWSVDEDAKWCWLMRLKTGNFETKTLKSVTSSNSEIVDVRLHFRSKGSEKPHRSRCTDRSIVFARCRQCVMWSHRRAPVTRRAAAFCADCRRRSSPSLMPNSSELQYDTIRYEMLF